MAEGLSRYHAYLVLDGSGSMGKGQKELISGKDKHLAVAEMVQKLIDTLHDDPELADVLLSVYSYDDSGTTQCLDQYEVQSETYYQNNDFSIWDPIIGHGGGTPIGEALDFIRVRAEQWVNEALEQEQRRAVIYLLSDGMNTTGRDPMQAKEALNKFQSTKGRIRLATVGYFQFAEGETGRTPDERTQASDEQKGRTLLKALPLNVGAYFESGNTKKILDYIKRTITLD